MIELIIFFAGITLGLILAKLLFIKKGQTTGDRKEVVIDFKVNSKDAEKDLKKLIIYLNDLKEQIPPMK